MGCLFPSSRFHPKYVVRILVETSKPLESSLRGGWSWSSHEMGTMFRLCWHCRSELQDNHSDHCNFATYFRQTVYNWRPWIACQGNYRVEIFDFAAKECISSLTWMRRHDVVHAMRRCDHRVFLKCCSSSVVYTKECAGWQGNAQVWIIEIMKQMQVRPTEELKEHRRYAPVLAIARQYANLTPP
jgi:hypothetical protein